MKKPGVEVGLFVARIDAFESRFGAMHAAAAQDGQAGLCGRTPRTRPQNGSDAAP
jgi:hypothetical protein